MNPKVRLNITEGRDKGKSFTFEDHDTFILGRMADCHVCIADDEQVSQRGQIAVVLRLVNRRKL